MAATSRTKAAVAAVSRSSLTSAAERRFRLTHATAGDHPQLYQLLLATCFGPSASEFHYQNEEPGYHPQQRLLVRLGGELISHALLSRREMRFGPLTLPAAELRDLATLPEYRRMGLGSGLVAAAEKVLSEQGVLLVLSRSTAAEFFLQRGWTPAARKATTLAEPRATLSYLRERDANEESGVRLEGPRRRLNIRLWRQVEQAPLFRLHAQGVQNGYGPWVRSDDYWRWLISRRGYDRMYVAIDGPDRLELTDEHSPLVGYAVVQENRIVELMTSPSHPHAGPELAARICADAVERNEHLLAYEGPASDPLHATLRSAAEARGSRVRPAAAEFAMARVLDPRGMLEALLPLFSQRLREADCRGVELGLEWGEEKFLLQSTTRGMKLVTGRASRSRLAGSAAACTQLVLGFARPEALLTSGAMEATTRTAAELAEVLFPKLPLWLPSLDQLPA